VNKFEALYLFAAWPPEHQRLCAEYWIETGEDRPSKPSDIEARLRNGEAVFFPFDRPSEPITVQAIDEPYPREYQPKTVLTYPREAAKVAAKPARNFMRYTRDEISEVDAHLSEGRGPTEISVMMVRKHPNKRTREAWRKMAQWVRKHGFLVSMNQAVEAEAK
jgi:hypothetical protein